MDQVKLLNRTDTKFCFPAQLLPQILEECRSDYRILEINSKREANYSTLYFDTDLLNLYFDHHNEKLYRYKIRIRNYVDSGLFYLEIKEKIKGRTVKSRKKTAGIEENLSEKSKQFISETLNQQLDLKAKLWNNFTRITLVSKTTPERLTIDFDLNFKNQNGGVDFSNLIIAEVKQGNRNRNSKIIEVLRKYGIRESGISKYCLGSISLNPELKYNNFKSKLLLVKKITQAA